MNKPIEFAILGPDTFPESRDIVFVFNVTEDVWAPGQQLFQLGLAEGPNAALCDHTDDCAGFREVFVVD